MQTSPALREQSLHELFTANDGSILKKIARIARRKGGSVQDGEDLGNDTFIEAEKVIREGKFERRSSLATFVKGIGNNLWLNRMRKKKDLPSDNLEPLSGSVESVESDFLKTERQQLVRQAISLLPDENREVLKLWSEGYSLLEIRQIRGHPNQAYTRNLLYRDGIERLRDWFKKMKKDEFR